MSGCGLQELYQRYCNKGKAVLSVVNDRHKIEKEAKCVSRHLSTTIDHSFQAGQGSIH